MVPYFIREARAQSQQTIFPVAKFIQTLSEESGYRMFSLFLTISLTLSVVAILWRWLSNPTYHPGEKTAAPSPTMNENKQHILLVCLSGKWFGGGETHLVTLYKMLLSHGYHATILVEHGSQLQRHLEDVALPFYTTLAKYFAKNFRPLYHRVFIKCLRIICTKERINIIHCNTTIELADAVKTAKQLSINIIYTRHVVETFLTKKMRGVSAVIAVSPAVTSYIESENQCNNLGIPIIRYIPPFFNAEKFLAFSTQQTRDDFFKKNFTINLHGLPVICTIANFYQSQTHKTHHLVFYALSKLIHRHHKQAHLMLAGNYDVIDPYINLAKQLAIEPYIHFLGFTRVIPALLYHSDFHVLPSSQEAFGLVHVEAAIMKKPSIGATNTGAETIIHHEKTGLLFKNNDSNDLAYQMERLIENPSWGKELGQNAYQRMVQNFVPEITFARHVTLYQEIASHAQQKYF